jgi:hypothetical protein
MTSFGSRDDYLRHVLTQILELSRLGTPAALKQINKLASEALRTFGEG